MAVRVRTAAPVSAAGSRPPRSASSSVSRVRVTAAAAYGSVEEVQARRVERVQILGHKYNRPAADESADHAYRDAQQRVGRVTLPRHVRVLREPGERVRRHRKVGPRCQVAPHRRVAAHHRGPVEHGGEPVVRRWGVESGDTGQDCKRGRVERV
jgi:hypothetical protein